MVVADIISFLGNQLFIYAATKSIALDLGYEYRYRVIRPNWAFTKSGNVKAAGHDYRHDFDRAFHIDRSERIEELPSSIRNKWTWERIADTSFNEGVYKISDNTNLSGHFLSPKYFEHRRHEVLKWFKFQDEYLQNSNDIIESIKHREKATHVISIHMRYGVYRLYGLSLDPSYYRQAVNLIRTKIPNGNLSFILLSDQPKEAKALLRMDDIIVSKGDLFEDLCLMTLCDGHIISNSTYSWWGAWLADSGGIVIRPSIRPISAEKLGPTDIFPAHWIAVEARREELTFRKLMSRAICEYQDGRVSNTAMKIKELAKNMLRRCIIKNS